MDTKNKIKSLWIAVILVVLASLTRLIHHPFNFTAIGAMALFSGAVFFDRRMAYLLPVAALLLTDLIIGFHASMIPVYGCFVITVWLGSQIRERANVFSIAGLSILSSVIFFLVTNLPIWYADLSLYPVTLDGTMKSYTMAIPFFRNELAGDLFYNAVLFGLYHAFSRQEKLVRA